MRLFRIPAFTICVTCFVSSAAGEFRFVDATKESGVDMTIVCGNTPSRHILDANGGGVAIFDYDNDEDLDLFFANGATMADVEHGPGCKLFRNRGDGRFDDVTKEVGINVTRWANGVAVGDVDGNGRDDIYITCYGPNILLKNQLVDGKTRFIDVTEKAGVGDRRWATSAAFGDIDNDDDLDLYVVNYLEFDVNNPPDRTGKQFKGVNVMAGPQGLTAQADVLYENNGDGTFKDVTKSSGCSVSESGYGLGVVMLDFDLDGKLDIFVGNDSTENFLFHNQGGGKFRNVGRRSGVSANFDGSHQATMGIAVGDVDNNGLPDLFSTNFSSDTNTLHANVGQGFFDDRTNQFGLGVVSRPFLGWGAGFYDFDLDGDEDLFIANGHVYPEAADHPMDTEYTQEPLLFKYDGKRFRKVEDAGPPFQQKYTARATAFGDLDGDGDVDIAMTTLNGKVRILRNEANQCDKTLVVRLVDSKGNPRGYGAMITLETSMGVQRRWLTGGGSYQSVDSPNSYFALPNDGWQKLTVQWVDGTGLTMYPAGHGHGGMVWTVTKGSENIKYRQLRHCPPSRRAKIE
jgi:hypothetical protein